ncbi:MAG: nucleotidyl transferase AbiEii/AbiGii toxin family protein [Gammaproteobacteria bacterium]
MTHNIFENEGYRIARSPNAHAGGKQIWEFDSLLNRKGFLEIDMNYLYRNPLWQPSWQYAKAWNSNTGVKVLDIHELAAGKLHALLDRDAARDLFDSYQLLTSWPLDATKLRLAFTVYAGIREKGWKTLNTDLINFDVKNIRNKLIPVLKREIIPGTKYNEIEPWGEQLVIGCKNAFERLLPFNDQEIKFLSSLDQGYIKPKLLTSDEHICDAVSKHPALHWRIMKKK